MEIVTCSQTSNETSNLEFNDLFNCPICYEKFEKPKVLTCLHTFCQLCLERHYGLGMPRNRVKKYKVISCPNCRELTVMSRGIDGLPDDSSITKMRTFVDVLRQLMTSSTEGGLEKDVKELHQLLDRIHERMSDIHTRMLQLAGLELSNLSEAELHVYPKRPKKLKNTVQKSDEYNPLLAKLKRIQDSLYVINGNLKSYSLVTDEVLNKLSNADVHRILPDLLAIGSKTLCDQSEKLRVCEMNANCFLPDSNIESKLRDKDRYELMKPRLRWQIGCRGSLPGMFQWPVDVVFTADDRILVADKNNHRLQLFDMNGKYLRSIGENHLGPRRIVVSGDEFHVSDEIGVCVKVVGREGVRGAWGECCFTSPCGLAIDSEKDFVMSDAETGCVSVFDKNFATKSVFKTRVAQDTSVPNPYFVATNSDDQIIVSDSYNNCVKIFAKTGQLLLTFGRKILACPRGVCLDADGNILVVDSDNHKVRLFNGYGEFKLDVLTKSDGLTYPMGVDFRDNMLVVTQCGFYGGHQVLLYVLEC